jgi:hypothetical protein
MSAKARRIIIIYVCPFVVFGSCISLSLLIFKFKTEKYE